MYCDPQADDLCIQCRNQPAIAQALRDERERALNDAAKIVKQHFNGERYENGIVDAILALTTSDEAEETKR